MLHEVELLTDSTPPFSAFSKVSPPMRLRKAKSGVLPAPWNRPGVSSVEGVGRPRVLLLEPIERAGVYVRVCAYMCVLARPCGRVLLEGRLEARAWLVTGHPLPVSLVFGRICECMRLNGNCRESFSAGSDPLTTPTTWLLTGLPSWCRHPCTWAVFCCFPKHVGRQLDGKPGTHTHLGCLLLRGWLKPPCKTSNQCLFCFFSFVFFNIL